MVSMVKMFLNLKLFLEITGDGGLGVAISAYVVFLGVGGRRRVPHVGILGSVVGILDALDSGSNVREGEVDDFDSG